MQRKDRTDISALKPKMSNLFADSSPLDSSKIEWQYAEKNSWGQSLLKNIGVASALVLCAVTLRTGAFPALSDATDAVLTAATDQSLLDDQLGKLSFVSALFPETVLVFGEESIPQLALPVSGGMVVHAWSEGEPYVSMRTNSSDITASLAGEVRGVYHGYGDERLVEVTNDSGMTCLYGNLLSAAVEPGDSIQVGDLLGTLIPGKDLVFEVRKNGVSIDPYQYMPK